MSEFRAYDRRRLSNRIFVKEDVKGDFRGGLATQSTFGEINVEDSPMDCMNFTNSIFKECVFTRCSLKLASFNACVLREVKFLDCDLDMAGFRHADLENVQIIGGRAEYSSFEDAVVTDLLLDTQLHGADLRFGKTIRVDFGKSNLWGATIKANCAFFAENRFDRRAVEMFIGLLSKSTGNDEIREKLSAILSPESSAMVERIVRSAREG